MLENLSYLFLSGLILGSGPCIGFCGPFLLAYTVAHKASLRASVLSYMIFSVGRIVSYMAWGMVCALAAVYFQSGALAEYSKWVYFVFGGFIIFLGLATAFGKNTAFQKICMAVHRGNVRNVGVAGFLAGLAPCLPLLGILNYVAIVSKHPWEAVLFLFVFGLGTAVSPLALAIIFSGKVSEVLSRNEKVKYVIQYLSAAVLVFLGVRIIWPLN